MSGRRVSATPQDGFVSLRLEWRRGDTITLQFPMPVRQVAADPKIAENAGRRAIMRGPLVYCLEDKERRCTGYFDGDPESLRRATR